MPLNEQQRRRFQEFQTMAAYLTTHPRLPEVVEELEDDIKGDRAIFNSANADSKGYLKSKGYELPEEWTISITQRNPITITGCIEVNGTKYCVEVVIDI
jgi:hypothetical protein